MARKLRGSRAALRHSRVAALRARRRGRCARRRKSAQPRAQSSARAARPPQACRRCGRAQCRVAPVHVALQSPPKAAKAHQSQSQIQECRQQPQRQKKKARVVTPTWPRINQIDCNAVSQQCASRVETRRTSANHSNARQHTTHILRSDALHNLLLLCVEQVSKVSKQVQFVFG